MNIDMNEGFKEGVWGVCTWGQEGRCYLTVICHLSSVSCSDCINHPLPLLSKKGRTSLLQAKCRFTSTKVRRRIITAQRRKRVHKKSR